jgi:site-specific recombinase XerD
MKDFTTYLIKNRFVEKSIQRMLFCTNHYLQWLATNNITVQEAAYKDLLNYIGHLQESKSKQVTNEHLRAISHYNRFLQIPDIAYQVRVRGIEQQQYIMFSDEELDKLYHHFETRSKKGYWRYSDKIILGLIVYQSLDTRDINRLKLEDLNLQTGKLNVPSGSRRKEGRSMLLEAHQILQLHHYIENHRDSSTEKLFSPQCSCLERLQGQLKDLFKQVNEQGKEIGLDIVRFNQIRQSRITLWIKQYGLRKTQYLVGFKHVQTVERYRQQDSEDLKQYVFEFHPLQ